ncbi:hypothetical protein DL771_003942 [Monosporascus sp. 5C6A]|nr:hypothetical protein DL771_003942 [Monosporascus sp. 5C6A]
MTPADGHDPGFPDSLRKQVPIVARGDDCPVPRKVLREALETLNPLFFPPNDPEAQQYQHRQGRPFHELGSAVRVIAATWAITGTGRSLDQLAGELEKEPYGWRQSIPEKNLGNLRESATVWLTAIVAMVLALGFGITSTYSLLKRTAWPWHNTTSRLVRSNRRRLGLPQQKADQPSP